MNREERVAGGGPVGDEHVHGEDEAGNPRGQAEDEQQAAEELHTGDESSGP